MNGIKASRNGLWLLLKNSRIQSIVFIGTGLAFIVGVIYLLLLRFGHGDVYPAYSSLRRDPLGSRAFHDSLARLPYRDVHRNYLPFERMPIIKGAAVFYLGARPLYGDLIHKDVLKKFERITDSGGRLVLAFYPENRSDQRASGDSTCKPDNSSDAEPEKSRQVNESENKGQAPDGIAGDKQGDQQDRSSDRISDDQFVSIRDHWGLSFKLMEHPDSDKNAPFLGEAITDADFLPKAISWHSRMYFKDPEASWKVLYTVDNRPVVVERQFGNGSMLFLADTYLFSNEALRTERYPQILAYAAGPNSTIIFDESHFGVTRQQGIVDLVRLYRFHWFFLVVILMAALYVWKNAVKFIPPIHGSGKIDDRGNSTERNYTHGLIGMLRRYIPKNKILQVCLQEYIETDRFGIGIPREKTDRIRAMADTLSKKDREKKNPVRVYQSICRMLKRKSL